jgi:hypothetical protein
MRKGAFHFVAFRGPPFEKSGGLGNFFRFFSSSDSASGRVNDPDAAFVPFHSDHFPFSADGQVSALSLIFALWVKPQLCNLNPKESDMLHAIKNLSSIKTEICEPWNVKTSAPPKDQWAGADLDHCFYSGFEGLVTGMRIGKNNPAVRLHWIVADYDGKIDQNMCDTVLERCADFHPQYICRIFSGGVRLLWRLETPFLLHSNDLTIRLMQHIRKKLGLQKIMVGLDTAAFSNPCQYYEAGTDWKQLSSDVIPSVFMMQWTIEASHKHASPQKSSGSIPDAGSASLTMVPVAPVSGIPTPTTKLPPLSATLGCSASPARWPLCRGRRSSVVILSANTKRIVSVAP